MDLVQCRNIAEVVAVGTGRLLKRMRSESLTRHEKKEDRTFATPADDAAERLIYERLREHFPDCGFLMEEGTDVRSDSEYVWVVDPLDGTYPYVLGVNDLYSVSIALCRNRAPLLGVAYLPETDDLYVALKNEPTTRNGTIRGLSPTRAVRDAFVAVEFGAKERERVLPFLNRLIPDDGPKYLLSRAAFVGTACQVLTGSIDAIFAVSCSPWDYAAASILLRNAGGRVTTLSGEKWRIGDWEFLSANPVLHGNLLRFLNR